jgi:glycerol-3-phosphate O-acyltransferase/dihydroxyacetone phosphate acyltransferase
LFKNPIAGAILLNAGNIPVDRKTKNNQILFRGTFEGARARLLGVRGAGLLTFLLLRPVRVALVKGEVVGVFPEGTSHNHSKMMPIKDGVAWTALEYLAYLEEHHGGADVGTGGRGKKPAVVVPVGLTYSDKTKYRSRVAIECVLRGPGGAPAGADSARDAPAGSASRSRWTILPASSCPARKARQRVPSSA